MEDLLGRDVLYEVAKIKSDLTIKTYWLTGEWSPWRLFATMPPPQLRRDTQIWTTS